MASNKTERRGSRVTASSPKGGGKREAAKISRNCQTSNQNISDLRVADVECAVYLDSCTSD